MGLGVGRDAPARGRTAPACAQETLAADHSLVSATRHPFCVSRPKGPGPSGDVMEDPKLAVARGILLAVVASVPAWLLIAAAAHFWFGWL